MNLKRFLLCICIFTVLISFSQSQVLGIDFGTQFWKASIISPGKNLIIVENSRSQRKTENAISFQDGIRFYESQAIAKRLRKPTNSYFYLNRLLTKLDKDVVQQNYKFANGSYYFEQDQKIIDLQQMIGMVLKNLKTLASTQAGTQIKDCVITVPADWGFKAKTVLVNAAYLAQLSVLGLINENSAAAINFGITRADIQPVNFVIFNLGSSNLQISIFKLFGYLDEAKNKTIESIQALSHVVVHDVGGLMVDDEIADYLAEQFKKKHKIDPRQNAKSFVKLLHKSSETKQVLSANKESTAYIVGLIDGIDMQISVKRQIIEQIKQFNEFPKYLELALKKANLQKEDINFVELIGGASRIPRVNNIVKQFFNNIEVGSHMNGDQSMAFGSALRAANISIALKVKQLHFYDGLDQDIKVVVSSAQSGVIHQQTIFTKKDQHGAKHTVILNKNDEDLKISIYHSNEIVREYITTNISDWKEKFEKENKTQDPTVVLNFVMSTVSISQLKQIYVNITINTTQIKEVVDYVEEQIPQEQLKAQEEARRLQQQAKKAQQQAKKTQEETQDNPQQNGPQDQANTQKNQEQNKEEANGSEDQQEKGQQNQEGQDQKQEQKQKEKQQKPKKKKQKKKKPTRTKTVKKLVEQFKISTKKHLIKHEQTYAKYVRLTKQQLQQKREISNKYHEHEQYLKDKAKVRNEFQSTLYSIKDHFDDEIMIKFSKEAQLSKLKQNVLKQIEWLDQNTWSATKQDFEKHFNELFLVYKPIYNRTVQYQQRQQSYNKSINFLSMTYLKTQELNQTNAWLGQKITDQLKKINDTADWISGKMKQQLQKPLNQDPVIYNNQIISRASSLRDQYYLLKMIPRPKIDPKKYKQQEEAKQTTTEETINLDDEQKESQSYEEDQQNLNESQDNQEQDAENNEDQNQENEDNEEEEIKPEDL